MERTFKSHAVLFTGSRQHHLVESSARSFNLVTVVTTRNQLHESFVQRAFESINESSLVSYLIKSFGVVRVEVADLADVLFALLLSVDTVSHATERNTVRVDLNGLTVRLKFKQVRHDCLGSGVQLL